jgi:hypothetical protein
MDETLKSPPEAPGRPTEALPVAPKLTKAGRPRKKTGPPKGVRPGGKQKGSKNKATLAREKQVREELERLKAQEAAAQAAIAAEVEKATGKPPVSGKDVLIQLVSVYMGLTALYQPWAQWSVVNGVRTNSNPNYDEAMFRHYSAMAKETAAVLTPFQHPRYSAMVVGASVVTKVEIDGGFPSDFRAPVGLGTVLPALTVISAEDEEPPALPKVVNE